MKYPREDLTKSHSILREPFHAREGFKQVGSQDEPWKLETRLNCIELAKEQDTGERGLCTI